MRRANVIIAAYLAIQVVAPLHYYTVNHDRYDERWAWRMFSPIRLVNCDLKFQIGDLEANVAPEFHAAWVNLAKRGRRAVVNGVVEHLCEQRKLPVRLTMTCKHVDGSVDTLSNGAWDLCQLGGLP